MRVFLSLLLIVMLDFAVPPASGQWLFPRGRRQGSAPGAEYRDGAPAEDQVNVRPKPVTPPPGPGVPSHWTLTPVKVSGTRTPIENNFETKRDSFSAPQVVLHPDTFAGSEIRDLAFSPDGRYLAVAGDVVRIWRVDSRELTWTLRGQREYGGIGGCTSVAYSPDGRHLVVAVAGHNASLRVYDTTDLSEIKEVYGGHEGYVVRLAFSRDGRYLATAGVDNHIHIWDWPQRKKVKSYLVDAPVVHLDFPSPHDNALAITKLDQEWKLFYWSLRTDEMAVEPERRTMYRLFHNATPIQRGQVHLHACKVDCDRGYSFLGVYDKQAVGRNRFRCVQWDGSRVATEFQHSYFVTAVTHHPQSDLVATGDALGQVHLFSVPSRREIAVFRSSSLGVFSVEFDGSSRLKFGREPYQEGKGWRLNHYADLTHYLDLTQQRLGVVKQEGGAVGGPAIADRLGPLRVSYRSDKRLSVERAEQTLSSITFGRSTEDSPNTCGLLRANDRGFTESVVVGFSNGLLAAYEPKTLQLKTTFLGHTGQVWCFSQSPDGRLLATGSGDNTIRIWSLRDGRHFGSLPVYIDRDGTIYDLVRNSPASQVLQVGDRVLKIAGKRLSELTDHLAATGELPFRPGQQAVVEYQSKGRIQQATIELSDIGDIVEPLLSIKVADDAQDWIAWTPRGYYAASSGGDRLIGWQENQGRDRAARFYYADQFRHRFDRPDIVLRAFETADLEQAVQLANEDLPRPPAPVDIRDDMPKLRPPAVRILTPSSGEEFDAPNVLVRAEITALDDAPIEDVHVAVNGRTYLARATVENPAAGATQVQVFETQIQLSPGENRLSVSARASSIGRSEVLTVTCAPFEVAPRLYVVAIGVNDYQHGDIEDLQYAALDAEQFVKAMELQKALGHFSEIQCRLLTDQSATRAGAEDAITWLVGNAQEEDVIAFFVSGHGLLDARDNYYLATHEANPDNPLGTCLNWRLMEQLVDDVPCRVLFFIDTCHAGGVLGGRTLRRNPYRNLHSQELGAFVFAAVSPGELAFERHGNGVFTKSLLAILADPASDLDKPADNRLSYGELYVALNQRVRDLSGGTQYPYIEKPQGLGKDVTIFRLPNVTAN